MIIATGPASGGLLSTGYHSVPCRKSAYQVNDSGNTHGKANPVMPQSEMRYFNRRKQLDRSGNQCGYEQENHKPCVGIEPCESILQRIEHFTELRPVDKQKCRHCIPEYPVCDFQQMARLDNYTVTFKMQNYADNQCDSKGNDQCDADVSFCFHSFCLNKQELQLRVR